MLSPDLFTIAKNQNKNQLLIRGRMDNENLLYIENGMLFITKENESTIFQEILNFLVQIM